MVRSPGAQTRVKKLKRWEKTDVTIDDIWKDRSEGDCGLMEISRVS